MLSTIIAFRKKKRTAQRHSFPPSAATRLYNFKQHFPFLRQKKKKRISISSDKTCLPTHIWLNLCTYVWNCLNDFFGMNAKRPPPKTAYWKTPHHGSSLIWNVAKQTVMTMRLSWHGSILLCLPETFGHFSECIFQKCPLACGAGWGSLDSTHQRPFVRSSVRFGVWIKFDFRA